MSAHQTFLVTVESGQKALGTRLSTKCRKKENLIGSDFVVAPESETLSQNP